MYVKILFYYCNNLPNAKYRLECHILRIYEGGGIS